MSDFTQMLSAVSEAERTFRNADRIANSIARLLIGRLRKCSGNYCAALKKELRDFDSRDHCWRE